MTEWSVEIETLPGTTRSGEVAERVRYYLARSDYGPAAVATLDEARGTLLAGSR